MKNVLVFIALCSAQLCFTQDYIPMLEEGNKFIIDASNFTPGLYFYQVSSEEKVYNTEKFIIK